MSYEYTNASEQKSVRDLREEAFRICAEALDDGLPVLLVPVEGGGLRVDVQPQLTTDRLLTAAELMDRWGYKSLSAFWRFVKNEAVPRVLMNGRVVRFPLLELEAWLKRRSTVS
jgi:predicted DNA-binding transcriptional regulator AlpA